MKVIYYMPVMLKQQALREDNQAALSFCELFKVVSQNACLIDRTGSGVLREPFETSILYPLPQPIINTLSYDDACLNRAIQLLQTGDRIVVMYSGGLDSTVVLLAFYEALQAGYGSSEQVVIASTPFSIIENPEAWEQIVLPNFELISMNACLAEMEVQSTTRYVMGENADQLFGSDILLTNPQLFEQDVMPDNIYAFVRSRNVRLESIGYVVDTFNRLYASRTIELRTMSDLIWWLNFTCKWQSVSLRALCFSKFLNAVKHVSELDRFATFFNTQTFQELAAYNGLERWGSPPLPTNYKLASRRFISKHKLLKGYADKKLKMPSLYRVLSSESHQYNALGADDAGNLYPVKDLSLTC